MQFSDVTNHYHFTPTSCLIRTQPFIKHFPTRCFAIILCVCFNCVQFMGVARIKQLKTEIVPMLSDERYHMSYQISQCRTVRASINVHRKNIQPCLPLASIFTCAILRNVSLTLMCYCAPLISLMSRDNWHFFNMKWWSKIIKIIKIMKIKYCNASYLAMFCSWASR